MTIDSSSVARCRSAVQQCDVHLALSLCTLDLSSPLSPFGQAHFILLECTAFGILLTSPQPFPHDVRYFPSNVIKAR